MHTQFSSVLPLLKSFSSEDIAAKILEQHEMFLNLTSGFLPDMAQEAQRLRENPQDLELLSLNLALFLHALLHDPHWQSESGQELIQLCDEAAGDILSQDLFQTFVRAGMSMIQNRHLIVDAVVNLSDETLAAARALPISKSMMERSIFSLMLNNDHGDEE